MKDELFDLQSRLAFQEAAIDELNRTVARQDQLIDALEIKLRELREQMLDLADSVGGEGSGAEPPPPHY